MTTKTLKEKDATYIANTYARFPLVVKEGKGATCIDYDGNTYIDLSSGIGVNSLGFADTEWVDAVCNQAKHLAHISNLFYTAPDIELAELLCKRSGMKKVFFANSGAEANEGAIKAARKYSFDKYGKGRDEIITLVNSFHGRTITTLKATGQEVFHQYFYPFTEGFTYAKANDIADVKDHITSKTCAIMIEMVQGEGGVIPLEKDFVISLRQLCDENDILLVADEVQTGIGRTGKLFAYEHFDITPDIVTAAKGLGGGLPIGAVLFSAKTADVFGPGDHGSTFGGNPIACAGACVVLKRLTDAMLQEITEKGCYLKKHLLQMPGVAAVDGMGMMLGITLDEKQAKEVVANGIQNGIILLTAKEKVRLLPPLTITYQEIDKALQIFQTLLAN